METRKVMTKSMEHRRLPVFFCKSRWERSTRGRFPRAPGESKFTGNGDAPIDFVITFLVSMSSYEFLSLSSLTLG